MQSLAGVDEEAFREEVVGATLDGIPAIVTARAAQGPNFQICISGRAAVNDVGLCSVRRQVRQAIGGRESHQVRLKILISKRNHGIDRSG